MSDDERFTGGLPTTDELAIGACIMLIRNVDVADGPANGTQGEIVDFKFTANRIPLVRFDNEKVGKHARLDISGYPPITPTYVSFS